MMAKNDVIGVNDVKKLLDEVGKISARTITMATKKGARIVLAWAKAHIYDNGFLEDTGTLKRSLRIKKEKRKTGKSVYQIGPDASGWYAHFVDYGFFATGGKKLSRKNPIRNKQTEGMTFIPGNRFLRDSVDINRKNISESILKDLYDALSKLR